VPEFSEVFATIIESSTQSPRAMDQEDRNKTVGLLNNLLDLKPNYLEKEGMQTDLTIVANLIDSNTNDNETAYLNQSDYQVSMLNYVEDFGSLFLRDHVRDQEGGTFITEEFMLQCSRNSIEGLPKVKFSVPYGNTTAGVKVPKDFSVGSNVTSEDALDSFLVMTNFKGFKIVSNDTAPPVNSTKYVGDVAIVSFKSKFSGVENDSGKVDLLPKPVTLFFNMTSNASISIPVTKIGNEANPNCTWLNETGDYWTTQGCKLVKYDSSGVLCNCTHFTQFSVQQSGEALVEAAMSANTEQAANLGAITEIDFSSNAIGLYCVGSILLIYIVSALFFYKWDNRDLILVSKMRKNPHMKLKMVFNRHREIYQKCLELEVPNKFGDTEDTPINTLQKDTPNLDRADKSSYEKDECPTAEDKAKAMSVREMLEARKNKDVDDNEIDDLTRYRQSLLIEYGVHPSIIAHKIDLEKSKPDEKFMFKVFINAYVPKRKTKWEYFVFMHPLLELIFLVNPTLRRVSRLTIVVAALLGQLFASGFFYNTGSSEDAEEEEPMEDTLLGFQWYDFWIGVLSAMLVLPVIWILNSLFNTPLVPKNLSDEEKLKMRKKYRVKLIVGYVIAWIFMAFSAYEVTIFAIQFNMNISQLWITTFSVSTIYGFTIQPNYSIIYTYLLGWFKRRKLAKLT